MAIKSAKGAYVKIKENSSSASKCELLNSRLLDNSKRACKVDRPFLEELDNYVALSYLRKSEIVNIYCRFKDLGEEVTTDLQHRFEKCKILQAFPQLSFNPFVDRIFHVFSSMKDEKMSFEDILDLASAFSEDCPIHVKAQWAFLMFDFDGDELLNKNDIAEIVTRLTKSKKFENENDRYCLTDEEIEKVADTVFSNIISCHSEGITTMEFINEVKKIPEFPFAFRLSFSEPQEKKKRELPSNP